MITSNQHGLNKVMIDGIVLSIDERRYSPSGVPKTRLVLKHESRQPEGDHFKKVHCQLSVQVTGSDQDPVLMQLKVGDFLFVTGYLIRNAYRNDQSWVKLQALSIEKKQVPESLCEKESL